MPRSVRKHIRRQKAKIRREQPAEKAAKAIERLTRGATVATGGDHPRAGTVTAR